MTKNRLLLIVAVLVAAVLVTGIATSNLGDGNGLDGNLPNGGATNGDVPNGGEPNGDEPNGVAAPDFTSGMGMAVDCDDNPGEGLETGDAAVDFRFQDATGTTFSLSDFRGKLVVLNFWTTWCGYCQEELPFIQEVYDDWSYDDLVLLAIDKGEDLATVVTFIQDEGYSLPIVMDEEQKVVAQYGVTAIPTTFFIDEEGIIQYKQIGYFHTTEDIEEVLNQILTTGTYVAEPAEPEEPEPDSAGLGFIVSCPQNPGEGLDVGDAALDFHYQDAQGLSVSLSDFRGQPVIVCFWATWCGYCNMQLPYLQQLYEDWQDTALVMITISKGEEPATVATFMQDEGLTFPVLTDSAQKAVGQYGVSGVPTTFFIDEEGVIQYKKVGYFHSLEDIEDILNQLFDW
jgi:peroxiredoxin